jgi:hypothetical protein
MLRIMGSAYRSSAGRTAPVSREFSSFTQTPSFHKKIKPAGNLSPRPPAGSFSVAPAGVEPTMGESKSPALPLGDGALSLFFFSLNHQVALLVTL